MSVPDEFNRRAGAAKLLGQVDDLLNEEARWVQGVAARDLSGQPCDGDYQFARCWCLTGAIDHFRLTTTYAARYRAEKALRRAIERSHGLEPRACSDSALRANVQMWNDAEARTFAEVKAIFVAARADIGNLLDAEARA